MPLNLDPYNGALGTERAGHLLRRATFGATRAEIDEFANLTAAEAINRLFNDALLTDATHGVPAPPIDPEIGTDWLDPNIDGSENNRQDYFKWWVVGQMFTPGVPDAFKFTYALREKITLFLHTYFTTKILTVNSSRALYYQNALFRLYAYDDFLNSELDFKELTKKVCVDNAMLIFLDGDQNVKGNINENFARENFELYTIGRGLESENETRTPSGPGDYFFFTEEDVREASKVLSGWDKDLDFANIDELTGLPRGVVKGGALNASQHTEGDKQFTAYFNNQVISPDPLLLNGANQTEASALDEISQLIEMIFAQEETAKHLCRKLYRFFVYYDVTTEVEDNIIQAMADTFVTSGYRLIPVLKQLFQSQYFYDLQVPGPNEVIDDKFGGIIKSPLDLVVGTYKNLEINIPDPQADAQNFYDLMSDLTRSMNNMGMDFYEPFEVAGYGAYHQFPRFNRNWISTHWLTQRYNFIRQLLAADMDGNLTINPLIFVQNNFAASAGDARQLIIDMAPYFFPLAQGLDFDNPGGDLTPARVRYFLQAFLGFSEYDTEADMAVTEWTALYADPNNYLEVTTRLTSLFNALMQSPEYQLF